MLTISDPELRALASGETIVAFVPRMTVTEGDELDLTGGGPLPTDDLKPAYQRWAEAGPPPGDWTGVVVSVDPAAILDPIAGNARHILSEPGTGDVVLLRMYGPDGPVLDEETFAARLRSVEGALGRAPG